MTKIQRLEAAGWKATSVDEFFNLTPEEGALVELRLVLSAMLRKRRGELQLSQTALAERINSSQSRIAKAEAGDPGISLDLLVRAVLATGATRAQLGVVIGSDPSDLLAVTSTAKGNVDLDEALEEMMNDQVV